MHTRSHYSLAKHSNGFAEHDEIYYALEICRWLLKPIGVWSFAYKDATKKGKVFSILLPILMSIAYLACSLFIMVPVYGYMLFDDLNRTKKLRILGPVSNCLLSVLKYNCLLLGGKTFVRFLQQMESDWKKMIDPQDRAVMRRQATICRRLIILAMFFLYTSGVAFHIMRPLFSRRVVGNVSLKVLAYPGYDRFFDTQSSPTYEILCCAQCFSGFMRFHVSTVSFSFIVVFVFHICGKMQLQIFRLEQLNYETLQKDAGCDPLGDIIQNHTEILRFAKKVGDAFSEIVLMEILGSTFLICVLLYCALVEWEDSDALAMTTYIGYLIFIIFNAMIFCYIGEILTDQIGFVSYNVDWYNLPPKKATGFVLINAISLYPPALYGAKLTVLSLNTFSIILKSSLVYLNLLQTMITS